MKQDIFYQILPILFCLVLLIIKPFSTVAQIPTDDLILHLPLNGNTNDSSGENNHGTSIGSLIPVMDRFKNETGAYSFNGSDNYISIQSSASLESPVNAISFALWVKITDWHNSFSVFLSKPNGNISQYDFYTDLGGNIYGPNRATCTLSNDKTKLELNKWYFLSLSWNGDTATYYIDGEKVGENTRCVNTLPVNNFPLEIGRDTPGDHEYFYGVMDDLRIYNRALNEEEMQLLYNEGETIPVAPINLSAKTVSNSEIELVWKDQSFNESNFILERTNAATLSKVEIPIQRNTTIYKDTSLNSNTTYEYRVKAINGNDESTFSELTSATTLKEIDLETGLVAYYPFDDTPNDQSGNNRNGQITGNLQSTRDRSGNINSAYSFDGSSYLTIPFDQPFVFKDFTYSVWVQTDFPERGWQTILTTNDNENQYLSTRQSQAAIWGRCGNDNRHGTITSDWHHLVWSVRDDTYFIYIDGVKVGTNSSCNDSVIVQNLYIGAENDGKYPFYGAIDEVQIYNRALNPIEISALYDKGGYEQLDAGLTSFNLEDFSILEEGEHPVQVVIKNFGETPLTNATIHWKVNGVEQDPEPWQGALNSQEADTVSLNHFYFTAGKTYRIEAYVSNPNGQTDNNPLNDSDSLKRIFVNPAKPHYALEFDGEDDYVAINSIAPLLLTSRISHWSFGLEQSQKTDRLF